MGLSVRTCLSAFAALSIVSVLVQPASQAAQADELSIAGAGQASDDVRNDINGDGAGDLLVGVPLETIGKGDQAGAVNVVMSNGKKLTATNNLLLSQRGPIPGRPGEGDHFGSAVELIDVNGDGYDDAVIGASGETVSGQNNAGSVHVILGSADGLDSEGGGDVYRLGIELPGNARLDDFFGFSLAVGDFDGDGYGDISVGSPFADTANVKDSGTVTVIYGSPNGLDTTRAEFFSQGGTGAGVLDPSDFFGWSQAVGDFNGDGRDDLVVGVPGQDHGSVNDSGAVNVLYGSETGLTTTGTRTFSQAGKVLNRPEDKDFFGFAVASSDLNCDGIDDLLVGVPNETLGKKSVVAGLVHTLLGSPNGVVVAGNATLAQGRRGVAGTRDFNQFGAAVVGGDFNGDGCGDIVVGAYTTDIGGDGITLCSDDLNCVIEAGAVVVAYGSKSFPTIKKSAQFSQAGRVNGEPQEKDFFGRTLAVLDINGDGADDLVIGVPREDLKGHEDAGQVNILRGSSKGLRSKRDYTLSQVGDIAGKPNAGDQFSSSLFDATS